MSMFFVPDELMPDARAMEANLQKISQDMEAMLPKGFAADGSAANMFAAPAAFMALGAGIAGHAFGVWLSAVSSSLQIAESMSRSAAAGNDPDADTPSFKAPKSASRRARAAVDTVVADAAIAAGDAMKVGAKAAREIAAANVVVPPKTPKVKVEKRARPAAVEKPAKADDLKAISGVGPKLEKVLNGLGLWTYRQIADLSEGEVRWLDEELGFRGRIARDEWLKQAERLAAARS